METNVAFEKVLRNSPDNLKFLRGWHTITLAPKNTGNYVASHANITGAVVWEINANVPLSLFASILAGDFRREYSARRNFVGVGMTWAEVAENGRTRLVSESMAAKLCAIVSMQAPCSIETETRSLRSVA